MAQRTIAPAASQARTFDTFQRVAPNLSGAKRAESLANSLGVALKTAKPLVEQYKKEEIEAGIAARTTGILKDGTRIRKGEIPPDQSTFWMQGFRVGEGRSKALDIQQEMTKRYESSGIQNSTRPEEYQAWYRDNLSEVMQGMQINDQYTRAGLMESLPGLQQNLNSIHVKNMRGTLERETLDLLSKETNNLFESYKAGTGVFKGSKSPHATLVNETSNVIQEAVNVKGMDPKKARKAAYDAYLQEAVRLANEGGKGDTDPIDLLNSFPRNERNAEINARLESDKQSVLSAINSRLTRQRNERVENTFQTNRQILQGTLQDPNFLRTPEGAQLVNQSISLDPEAFEKLKPLFESQGQNVITLDKTIEQDRLTKFKSEVADMVAIGDVSGARALYNQHLENGYFQRPGVAAEAGDFIEETNMKLPYLDHAIVKDYDLELKESFLDPKGTLATTLMNLNDPSLESRERSKALRLWNRSKDRILVDHITKAREKGQPFNIRDKEFRAELEGAIKTITDEYNNKINSAAQVSGQQPQQPASGEPTSGDGGGKSELDKLIEANKSR